MQSLRSEPSRVRQSKLFKAADPADKLAPIVARLAFLVPSIFLLIGLELERSWLYFPYFVTEWMVNYTGGFLRRGLLGEIFWLLGAAVHTSPMILIEVARFGIAIGFSGVIGSLVFKNRNALGWVGALLILVNPYLSFYLWCNTGSLDLFFVLITAAHLKLTKLDPKSYLKYSAILFATAGVFIALTHEALLFICLPINAAIFLRTVPRERLKNAAMIFAAPVVACLVAIAFHGTPEQANAIYRHWNAIGFNQPFKIGFEQIGLTFPQEVHLIWQDFTFGQFGVWMVNVLFCIGPLIWMGLKLGVDKGDTLAFFAIPFLASLPLYIVGSDWDRWFSITVITAVVAFLTVQPFKSSLKPNAKMTATLAVIMIAGLFVRPYAPFLPAHRFVAGPITRMEEYLRGQVPR